MTAVAAHKAVPATVPPPQPDPFLARTGRAIARGDLQKAGALCDRALEKNPGSAEACFVRAVVAWSGDDWAQATASALEALDCDPTLREAADIAAIGYGLAGDLINCVYFGKLGATMTARSELAALLPPSLPVLPRVMCEISEQPLLARGVHHLAAGEHASAEHWLRQHLAFFPDSRDAYVGIALALMGQGSIRAAIDLLRAARHLFRDDTEIATVLGKALTAFGRFGEASACHRWAVDRTPQDAAAEAAWLADLLSDPAREPAELAARVRAWGERHGRSGFAPVAARPAASDRLSIGLLIADAGSRADASGAARIFACRDEQRFRVVGFGWDGLATDRNSDFQAAVDRWHDVADCDALTFGAMVRSEHIDILVSVAGFSAPDLLAAFGERLAPCQVAWLGSAYGTGLAAMDWLLTDRFVDAAPDEAGLWRETLEPLDLGCVPIFTAIADGMPPAACGAGGGLTLAADATLADLDAETIACWAEILGRLPGATLLLRDHDFRDPQTVSELIGRFGTFGISDRIDVVSAPSAEMLFAQADVALMPLHSAAPEAIAAAIGAGVPPVCPAGRGRHRRMAGSVLHHLGLGDETLAEGAAAYVARAVHWAQAPDPRASFAALLASRKDRREALDPRRRARDLEAAFERMWRETLARQH